MRRLLARMMITGGYGQFIVLDPKAKFEPIGNSCVITSDIRQIPNLKSYRVIIYRTPAMNDPEANFGLYDSLFSWAYKQVVQGKGKYTFLIDETYAMTPNGRTYPSNLNPLYTRGGSLGITMIALTQRPVGFPVPLFSECDTYVCFQLQALNDRKRMAETMGDRVLSRANGYGFYHYRNSDDSPMYWELQT